MEGNLFIHSYLNSAFVRFFSAVCPHVCVELAHGGVLFTTSWTLMPKAKEIVCVCVFVR